MLRPKISNLTKGLAVDAGCRQQTRFSLNRAKGVCMVLAMTASLPHLETSPLDRPVSSLFGVGPERAAQLGKLEIFTVADLLLHRPRRYEDRRRFRPVAELEIEKEAFTGQVEYVDILISPESRTCKVTAIVPNREERLRSGLEARMEINLGGPGGNPAKPLR